MLRVWILGLHIPEIRRQMDNCTSYDAGRRERGRTDDRWSAGGSDETAKPTKARKPRAPTTTNTNTKYGEWVCQLWLWGWWRWNYRRGP